MSRLQELIQRLCPNGVEFKTLGELAKVQRGVRVVKSELHESGDIPVYQNSLKPLGYSEQSNFSANKTYIIAAGGAGDLGFSEIPFWAADDCYVVLPQEILLDKFLYYIILNQQSVLKRHVRKASIPRLSKLIIEKLSIPVPPMEVQEEIVKILDRFSDYAAELQARKEQYEYYRNLLLTFNPAGYANGADGAQKIDVTTWGGIVTKLGGKLWARLGHLSAATAFKKRTSQRVASAAFTTVRYTLTTALLLPRQSRLYHRNLPSDCSKSITAISLLLAQARMLKTLARLLLGSAMMILSPAVTL